MTEQRSASGERPSVPRDEGLDAELKPEFGIELNTEFNTEAINDEVQGVGSEQSESTAGLGVTDAGATPPKSAAEPAEPAEPLDAETFGAETLGAETRVEHPDTVLAAERLADLQRLQAEYINYKRRVDRDRAMVQELAVHSVIEALLPVLDDIHAARQHGDLESGPFAAIAEKLESTLGKFGLSRFGATGDSFDPLVHEALMHAPWPKDGSVADGADTTTVVQVLQPGYRAGERVIRPARVAVADPE